MTSNEKSKILIIDDEKMNIIALAQFLTPQYSVMVAVNGCSGLETAEKHRPDLILLDVLMPDLNGFEVLKQLKAAEATMNIPVVFITGMDKAENEETGLLLGAVDYIVKPFRKAIVEARIKTHLKMAEYVRTIELCGLDALTGLPNRQGFGGRMNAEWELAFRKQTPLGLILADIDRLKAYNGAHGHSRGDTLLQAVAGVFAQTLDRIPGLAARRGGGKFGALLPGLDTEKVAAAAEQVRKNVENTVVPHADGSGASVTVSLGAASTVPGDGLCPSGFVAEVDDLLGVAKKNGGNQVCAAQIP